MFAIITPTTFWGLGENMDVAPLDGNQPTKDLRHFLVCGQKKVDVILIIFVFFYLRLSAVYLPKYVLFRLKIQQKRDWRGAPIDLLDV